MNAALSPSSSNNVSTQASNPATAPVQHALILAAGRGERMRPLTDKCPKPLLEVQGKPLIVWHLERLARAGVRHVVINTAWLEDKFEPVLGNGSAWGLSIKYSHEGAAFGGALETAGGIATALPLLGIPPAPKAPKEEPAFWVMAGDVFMPDFELSAGDAARFVASRALAHLVLVPNPAHNPEGDFGLSPGGMALNRAPQKYTYSTVGLFRPSLFAGIALGHKAALAPLLRTAMQSGRVSAALYLGEWTDVGTPERLAALQTG
jgi:N-acetyl-alpha-D-muramate 1-phosphate uridylyltransferase